MSSKRARLMKQRDMLASEDSTYSDSLASSEDEWMLDDIRRQQSTFAVIQRTASSKSTNMLEKAEAIDVFDDEDQELLVTNPCHVVSCFPEIGNPSTSSVVGEAPARPAGSSNGFIPDVAVRHPSSGMAQSRPSTVHDDSSDGSGMDSDEDDEYEINPAETLTDIYASRDILNDRELDEPLRDILTNAARAMDDEADRLLGTLNDFKWHKDFDLFRGAPELFTGPTPGAVKDYDLAYDAFVDIWDKDIIDHIVTETNRYAQQKIEESLAKGILKPSSRMHRWHNTDANEIMVLFAIFQLMAIDPRTTVAQYWENGYLGMPEFRNLMNLKRFQLLNKFLHFTDNSGGSQDTSRSGATGSTKLLSRRLAKLSPIISHLERKFDSLYHLSSHISIDASLTLFKDCPSWTQTIRSNESRSGTKSYELSESSTGYLARFQLYTGKSDANLRECVDSVDFGRKSTKIVLELLQGLEGRGHCVTMDHFYNCPALARYLKTLGFDCLGTLRTYRRYVPSAIANVPANVSKGTIISRHCGDVSIVSWKDSKMVNIISTYHNADTYVGSRGGVTLTKPVCVRDYNSYMGGVVLKDRNLSMYPLERKRGLKWYQKIFKKLMNVSIFNSMIMLRSSLKRRDKPLITHRQFRYQLVDYLLKRHGVNSQLNIPNNPGELMRLRRDVVHYPEYFSGKTSRRRCRVCYINRGQTVSTRIRCGECEAFLCAKKCWISWHTEEELKSDRRPGRKRIHDKVSD